MICLNKTKLHFDNGFFSAPLTIGPILLYQAGDCFAMDGFKISEHKQVCYEISYIVSGSGEFWLNDKSYSVSAGDLFFCPKDSKHKIISSKDSPVRYCYLGFNFIKKANDYNRWAPIESCFLKIENPVIHRAFNFNHLFNDLLCEFQQDFSNKQMLIENSVFQIILHAHKIYSSKEEAAAVYKKRIPDKDELVYEIVNYIEHNVLRIKSLTDISKYLGFSYSYTSQIFNSVMNLSLNDYYQKKRFDEAIKLLKNGLSVTQVSEILGFISVNSFSRAFKSRFNASPKNYLKITKGIKNDKNSKK